MENRHQITAKQLGIFILSSQVGLGVIGLYPALPKTVGHDGWIAILGAGVLSSISIAIIIALLRRYGEQSIFEINRYLFGNFFGQTVNLLLLLYLSFLMIAAFRYFTEFIKLFTLETTPELILALLIIVPTAYLSWYGLKPVARFSTIIFFILFCIVLLSFSTISRARLTFLLPVGAADPTALLKSIALAFLSFIGLELTVFLYPYVIENNRPAIDMALAFTASLVEYRRDALDQPPVQKKIEEQLARQIKQACLEIIHYTQEIGSDPIGIGDLVRAKYPAYWQRVNWREAYREATVNLQIKLDILQYGAIT